MTTNEFSAASLIVARNRAIAKLAARTAAELAQDTYAQAALAYENATVATGWAEEDLDEEGGAERLERCRANQRERLQVLLSAMEAFDALSDAERASVSLRDPLNADGTVMSTGELRAANDGAANAL